MVSFKFNSEFTRETIIGWTCCGICWLIALFLIYYCVQFYLKRRVQIIHKRYVSMVLLINIFAILYTAIQRPLDIMRYSGIIESQIVLDCASVLYSVCHYSVAYAFLARIWLLRFDILWTVHIQKQSVLHHINSNYKANNWYILHKNQYGNIRYVGKLLSIPCVVSILVSMLRLCLFLFYIFVSFRFVLFWFVFLSPFYFFCF